MAVRIAQRQIVAEEICEEIRRSYTARKLSEGEYAMIAELVGPGGGTVFHEHGRIGVDESGMLSQHSYSASRKEKRVII